MSRCRFPGCKRAPRKGHTTCDRHYTAGDSLKNDRKKIKSPPKKESKP